MNAGIYEKSKGGAKLTRKEALENKITRRPIRRLLCPAQQKMRPGYHRPGRSSFFHNTSLLHRGRTYKDIYRQSVEPARVPRAISYTVGSFLDGFTIYVDIAQDVA